MSKKFFPVFLVSAAMVLAFAATTGFACSVCMGGSPDDPANVGLRRAILLLLGVVGFVLFILTGFFLNIRKRTRLLPER